MGQSIIWATPHAEWVDDVEDFSDAYGTKINEGNVALWIDDGVIMEGTREQFLALALQIIGTVEDAPIAPASARSTR